MRVALRFARGLLAMLVALAVLTASEHQSQARPAGASADRPAQSRYLAEEDRGGDRHGAFLDLATRYTETMLIGLLTGGLIMNQLVGGSAATMAGTIIGTIFACWISLGGAKETYVVREIR